MVTYQVQLVRVEGRGSPKDPGDPQAWLRQREAPQRELRPHLPATMATKESIDPSLTVGARITVRDALVRRKCEGKRSKPSRERKRAVSSKVLFQAAGIVSQPLSWLTS